MLKNSSQHAQLYKANKVSLTDHNLKMELLFFPEYENSKHFAMTENLNRKGLFNDTPEENKKLAITLYLSQGCDLW